MTFSLSVLCMQTDRFLAILWSVHYKDRVTTNKAVAACSLSYLVSTILTSGVAVFVRNYTACVIPAALRYTRPSTIALEDTLTVLAVAATLTVSIYAVVVDRRLKKLQPAPVNLPDNSQRGTSRVQRINSDPHVFFVTEGPEVIDQVTCTINFPKMLKNTLMRNIILFVSMMIFPINVVLDLANTNCDKEKGECDGYIFVSRCLAPFKFIFGFISLALYSKMLKNMDI